MTQVKEVDKSLEVLDVEKSEKREMKQTSVIKVGLVAITLIMAVNVGLLVISVSAYTKTGQLESSLRSYPFGPQRKVMMPVLVPTAQTYSLFPTNNNITNNNITNNNYYTQASCQATVYELRSCVERAAFNWLSNHHHQVISLDMYPDLLKQLDKAFGDNCQF